VYRFLDDEKIDLNNPKNILTIIYRNFSYTDIDLLKDIKKITYIVTSLSNKQVESINYAEASVELKK
jgi:hypothetical protein